MSHLRLTPQRGGSRRGGNLHSHTNLPMLMMLIVLLHFCLCLCLWLCLWLWLLSHTHSPPQRQSLAQTQKPETPKPHNLVLSPRHHHHPRQAFVSRHEPLVFWCFQNTSKFPGHARNIDNLSFYSPKGSQTPSPRCARNCGFHPSGSTGEEGDEQTRIQILE